MFSQDHQPVRLIPGQHLDPGAGQGVREHFVKTAMKDLRWSKRRAVQEAGCLGFFYGCEVERAGCWSCKPSQNISVRPSKAHLPVQRVPASSPTEMQLNQRTPIPGIDLERGRFHGLIRYPWPHDFTTSPHFFSVEIYNVPINHKTMPVLALRRPGRSSTRRSVFRSNSNSVPMETPARPGLSWENAWNGSRITRCFIYWRRPYPE